MLISSSTLTGVIRTDAEYTINETAKALITVILSLSDNFLWDHCFKIFLMALTLGENFYSTLFEFTDSSAIALTALIRVHVDDG